MPIYKFLMYIELVSFTVTFNFGDMANYFLHYLASSHVHLDSLVFYDLVFYLQGQIIFQ